MTNCTLPQAQLQVATHQFVEAIVKYHAEQHDISEYDAAADLVYLQLSGGMIINPHTIAMYIAQHYSIP